MTDAALRSSRHDALWAKDQAHVWHPFTQMQLWEGDAPLIIERAEGNWLIDTRGDRYLDGISSLWVTVHGHRKAELDAALVEQLGKVAHSTLLGMANVPSIELAAELVRRAPVGLTKVFYSDSGSTAVEVAMKMAYQYWQQKGRTAKTRFAALAEAYHGDTLGAVSVGGVALFHEKFKGLVFDVERLPTPHAYRWAGTGAAADTVLREALAAAEALFKEKGSTLAALVVEPLVQGAAGMLLQPPGYLKALQHLCRSHDVLLICDEVATGFGRTGTFFAVEQEQVRPDFLCVAKGLTGGYLPLAATLTTQRVFDAFSGTAAERKTFFHGHTYTGNPLACAVALANLKLFDTEKTLERMRAVEPVLARGLDQIAALTHVGEVRRRGFMVGIELVADRATRAEYPYGDRVGLAVCTAARKHGVLLRPLGNVLVLMPPLSLSADEAQLLVDAVLAAVPEVCGT